MNTSATASLAARAVAEPPMPKGIHNAYLFDIFNATSWTIVLGPPMLLWFQHLHASATIMAVSAGLSPVLMLLCIPAARIAERIGYRRLVLRGWAARGFIQVAMTMVAFLPDSVDPVIRIALMLFLSFIFCVLRGISSSGVLPWLTHLVPANHRGRFVARDQAGVALATVFSLLACGLFFGPGVRWYSFGSVFVISTAGAFTSLFFLLRIPDVPVEKIPQNPNPLPWREMFFYPPFFRYIRYNIVINLSIGASAVFWIRFFRVNLHASNSITLFNGGGSSLILVAVLFLVAPLVDRVGNRPILTLSGLFLIAHYLGWCLVAAGVLPFNLAVMVWQAFTSGIGGALWNLGNLRSVMSIAPENGRVHFLALYNVASNLTLAISPMIWGLIVDALGGWRAAWGFWSWNIFTVFYLVLAGTVMAGLLLLREMPDSGTMPWHVFMRELLVKSPGRAVGRLITRLRAPETL